MLNVRKDFPFLKHKTKGKTPIYFDSAATTQKPKQVINAISNYYETQNANPHRGVYELSEKATYAYESSREITAKVIGAKTDEIVFTANATHAMNLIKNSFAQVKLKRGDRILISAMEHHANIVPWLLLKQHSGIELDYIELTSDGKLQDWQEKITPKTKLISIAHASNVLGTINDVKEICKVARENGIHTVIDGAQAAPHLKVDVKKIGCDFYVFSGHKMLGPMGIGVLYGRKELLEEMPPSIGGGDMILRVERQKALWNDVPWKFEAGTPNVEGAVGLKAAIQYLQKIGLNKIEAHERKLTGKMLSVLRKFKKIKVLGPKSVRERVCVVAFTHDKIHPHDLATIMNEHAISIRSGHHCAMPLHQDYGIPASSRASFYVYNTLDELDFFEKALEDAERVFGV